MRSYVPAYELIAPRNLDDALSRLTAEPGIWKAFAGGTDLMVFFEAGNLAHTNFIDIRSLPDLKGIHVTPGHVAIGALTTYTEIRRDAVLQTEFPLLCQAARETGGIATQNRGTLGGNIANASPAADSPPALLVYDAELELISTSGPRRVPYHAFHTGYKQMDLHADEWIARILLPRRDAAVSYYRKVGARKAQAISKVCFAARAGIENGRLRDIRIALGSVAPTPIRCRGTEAALEAGATLAEAQAALAADIAPIDDLRSTARYRRRVAQNLLEEFLGHQDHR